mgnify:CR=1 FL=1
MLSIFIRQSACCGLLTCPGTGLTAEGRSRAQFAFGFYSIMLTSSILGIITLLLFKPRSWCVYCPMGTITQLICRWKHRK